MEENYKILDITCPNCGISKGISVPETIFARKKIGSIKIQVPTGAVCPEHQFIAFVDSKGRVQGYEKIDIRFSIVEKPEIEERGILTLRRLILIFGTYAVFCLMHGKIFNYKTYILIDDKFKFSEDLLNLIGAGLIPERYRGKKSIHVINDKDYANTKIEKDALILDTHRHILQTPWEEKLKLKFEESMIKKALEIFDEEEQLLILQKDIANFIKEAEYTIEILEGVKQIYEDELKKKLSKELMLSKMNRYRFNLIKEFITRRISSKITKKITGDYFGYLKTISQKK